MKCTNYEKVLKYIQSSDLFHNRLTDIEDNIDLCAPTIRKIVRKLIDEGKVVEVKHGTAKHYQAIGDG